MKSFSLFLREVVEAGKEIVLWEPPEFHTTRQSEDIRYPHPASEVTHGAYEKIDDMIPKNREGDKVQKVHEFLASHENPHGLVSGILGNMSGSEEELIHKHNLHDRINDIVGILSDPHYLKSFRMSI